MKYLLYLFFISLVNCEQIIRNVNIPSCKNCIHFRPNILDNDYSSFSSRCQKFGERDLITNKVNYDFANYCRIDENKCGENGKYYEKDSHTKLKMLKHKLIYKFIDLYENCPIQLL